jgi:hypothetical protein
MRKSVEGYDSETARLLKTPTLEYELELQEQARRAEIERELRKQGDNQSLFIIGLET